MGDLFARIGTCLRSALDIPPSTLEIICVSSSQNSMLGTNLVLVPTTTTTTTMWMKQRVDGAIGKS
jgi:hypothetical protein